MMKTSCLARLMKTGIDRIFNNAPLPPGCCIESLGNDILYDMMSKVFRMNQSFSFMRIHPSSFAIMQKLSDTEAIFFSIAIVIIIIIVEHSNKITKWEFQCFLIKLEFGNVEGKPMYLGKNPQSKDENPQQPTHNPQQLNLHGWMASLPRFKTWPH